ncbi:MAG: BatA domain-containing protein [Verrucomicrobia bacterium]|nr:BatA domain-containing protein [Verrucomicrobiota bacterium]
MTWLFPLYLLGGAAIIGPILMHLRRRPPQDRVEFSSLMFLDAQPPMPVSKRRLENWLLLLLRCLALLLLALMFARPLWRSENADAVLQNQATVLLLDRSASMQRGDLWKQAITAATTHLEKIALTDRLAVATMDRETTMLWSFDQDKTSASTRLATLKPQFTALKPGWASTDLGKALVDAAGWFSGAQGMSGLKKRIVVITDFQEGSRLDALRGIVWPENIAVEMVRVDALNSDNFTLSLAANTEESVPGQNDAPTTRVRLSNTRDSRAGDFKLTWDKGTEAPITGYLPPGASRVLSLPGTAGMLTLAGDDWDFDNRIYIAPSPPKAVKIVFIGDEKSRSEAASPLFYLSRALQPTPSLLPVLTIVPESAASIPTDTELVFISGARLSAPLIKSVRALSENGGLVVRVVTESTTPQDLESLTGIAATSWSLGFSRPNESTEDYQMLSDVQTTHPLMRPFADERLRDFTKLHFWEHRKLTLPKDSPLEILARFDQGDPAILARSLGKGRIVLLTSGWHPADSQLALSTKFVPLLYGWIEAAGFRNEQAASLLVGDVLHQGVTASSRPSPITIVTPDGQTITPKPGDIIRAELPGVYTINKDRQLAVNLAPEEGRITPMGIAKLRELGVRIEENKIDVTASLKAEDKERLAITEHEAQQRAWIWLLGLLLAILAWETWLAGRIRQGTLQPAYSSP